MCGITGFWAIQAQMNTEEMETTLRRMTVRLEHRGPDAQGLWLDAEVGVGLGHQRLAILDLSTQGHQPMISAEGRYVLVFNGEIYNFRDLHQDLVRLGYCFKSHSDTEVMLNSFSAWGVETAIQRFNGMFAFSLWDRQERCLYLGRDRLGEKPLYYGWVGHTLVFGSELKALLGYPRFPASINRDALALYLRYRYIPAPYSIYHNIYKLPPASLLCWKGEISQPQPFAYWKLQTVVEGPRANLLSETQLSTELEALLLDAVKLRMIADVPLGAFLSGGIDSSMIVALMQLQSQQPVKTFTIGFENAAYNEATYAKAIAQHLGTDHTELYVTASDTLQVIPKLPKLYDEPFADASQIPTYLVSQLTRQQVTVSLSGDGGDELFAGYNRYFWGQRIWQISRCFPLPLRQLITQQILRVSPSNWDHWMQTWGEFLPTSVRSEFEGEKLHKLTKVLMADSPESLYWHLVSTWSQPDQIVLGSQELATAITQPQAWAKTQNFVERMMYLDTIMYLSDDILAKVDRASMGVALEARIPFLDHRVVEFAWQIPIGMKLRRSKGKYLLRQLLYKYVPKELIDRPKSGFGIPISDWLRGPIRDWAETLLTPHRLQQEGFFDPKPIQHCWQMHLSGQKNQQYEIWAILMFQAWLEESKKSATCLAV